ncbi:MAG TPA: glycoside hydrolase family 3 N-terminal domain-containing protein [Micromonosporaceae bacterium]
MRAEFRRVLRLVSAGLVPLVVAVAGCSAWRESPVNPSQSPPPMTSSPAPPSPSAGADPAVRAAATVAKLTDADLVGQVLMPTVNLADPASASAALVTRYRLGGVILMGNVQNTTAGGSAAAVRALTDRLRTAAAELPAASTGQAGLVVGTDQEYGWVTRIKSGLVQLPSAMAFGAAARPDLTEAAWRGAGAELAATGIDVDFAPDADVLGSAGNYVIGSRSYGSDPAAVSAQVAAAVRGLQGAGVGAALKHFPGHGHTTVNSHEALPVLSQTRASLDAADLPPFQAGIDAGTWLVMSGHLDVRAIDPGIPASFSRKVLVDLLRTRMKFTGVVVSDALNMAPAKRWPPGEAAVRALVAGNDLLLMPPDLAAAHQGLLAGLANGSLPRTRLVEAATRVLTLKYRLAAFPRPALSTVEDAGHRDAALAVAAAAVTVLKGACSGPLVSGGVRITASAGREREAARLTAALRSLGVPVVTSGGSQVHLVGYGDGSADLVGGAAVTVSMDTPFVLRWSTSPVRIATYASTEVSLQALASVLAGKARAPGRSPVAVTGLPRSACVG